MSELSAPDRSAELLTEGEVARVLRVSGRTVRRWAATGTLSAVQIGGVRRYRAAELHALLAPENSEGAPAQGAPAKESITATQDAG